MVIQADWADRDRDSPSWAPESLESVGFVHCCWPEQLAGVLERWFLGRDDLFVLDFDPTKITGGIKEEDAGPGTELHPHVYGPLDLVALRHVREIRPEDRVPPGSGGTSTSTDRPDGRA